MAEPSSKQRRPATQEVGNLSIQNHNVETLTGDKTLTDSDDMSQVLDPGGAGRTVTLPADDVGTTAFLVSNTADAAEDLTINDSEANAVATVSQNEAALVLNTGSGWVALAGAAATGQNV